VKKHYPWLWFDADGTLFDYSRAEATALRNAFHSLTLPFEDDYLGVYRGINTKLWRALEQQEITPTVLRFRQFELLESLQLSGSPDQMSTAWYNPNAEPRSEGLLIIYEIPHLRELLDFLV